MLLAGAQEGETTLKAYAQLTHDLKSQTQTHKLQNFFSPETSLFCIFSFSTPAHHALLRSAMSFWTVPLMDSNTMLQELVTYFVINFTFLAVKS